MVGSGVDSSLGCVLGFSELDCSVLDSSVLDCSADDSEDEL